MRNIQIENDIIKELLVTKEDLVTKGRELTKQINDLESERNKIGLKIQKVKDKIIPAIEKAVKPLLENDFEDIESVKIENDKISVNIFDHAEEFKKTFLKNKRK